MTVREHLMAVYVANAANAHRARCWARTNPEVPTETYSDRLDHLNRREAEPGMSFWGGIAGRFRDITPEERETIIKMWRHHLAQEARP